MGRTGRGVRSNFQIETINDLRNAVVLEWHRIPYALIARYVDFMKRHVFDVMADTLVTDVKAC